jgi:hypothetical protein
VARHPQVVSSARRRARWSPTAGVARPPRVVLSQWRLRGSLCVVRIRCFHPVGWCVVWQRHYGGGSRMAWPSLVRCGPFLSFPYRRGAIPDGDFMCWRRLLAAAARLRFCLRCPAEWSCPCRCPNPTGLSCLVETSGVAYVDVPIRPT